MTAPDRPADTNKGAPTQMITTHLTSFENGTSAFQHQALAGLPHGFFTRQGGVSGGIYDSLNTGYGSDDESALITQNRARAFAALGLPAHRVASLYQIHSAELVYCGANWQQPEARPQADGLATDQAGLALSILTADCAPVMLADKQAQIIGACHAGWRGAAGGIIQQTINGMVNLGACKENIIMVIGPTIAQQSYQVGAEMRDAVLAQTDQPEQVASLFLDDTECSDKFFFNLPRFCQMMAERAGLQQIYDMGIDTYSTPDLCFSHRRATHEQAADTGRLMMLISLPTG